MKKSASIDLSFLKHVRPGFNETLGTQSGIQALDVILRHGPLSFCFPVGKTSVFHYLLYFMRYFITSKNYLMYIVTSQPRGVRSEPWVDRQFLDIERIWHITMRICLSSERILTERTWLTNFQDKLLFS